MGNKLPGGLLGKQAPPGAPSDKLAPCASKKQLRTLRMLQCDALPSPSQRAASSRLPGHLCKLMQPRRNAADAAARRRSFTCQMASAFVVAVVFLTAMSAPALWRTGRQIAQQKNRSTNAYTLERSNNSCNAWLGLVCGKNHFHFFMSLEHFICPCAVLNQSKVHHPFKPRLPL